MEKRIVIIVTQTTVYNSLSLWIPEYYVFFSVQRYTIHLLFSGCFMYQFSQVSSFLKTSIQSVSGEIPQRKADELCLLYEARFIFIVKKIYINL